MFHIFIYFICLFTLEKIWTSCRVRSIQSQGSSRLFMLSFTIFVSNITKYLILLVLAVAYYFSLVFSLLCSFVEILKSIMKTESST